MKVTEDRLLCDFRDTLKEIVNVKNGRQRADALVSGKDGPIGGRSTESIKGSLKGGSIDSMIHSSQGYRTNYKAFDNRGTSNDHLDRVGSWIAGSSFNVNQVIGGHSNFQTERAGN